MGPPNLQITGVRQGPQRCGPIRRRPHPCKTSDSRPGPAWWAAYSRICYDCLGGANARFLLLLTNNFLGSPNGTKGRQASRQCRSSDRTSICSCYCCTPLPMGRKIWKSVTCVVFVSSGTCCLAVYQSVHPLIFCISHQRDRGEKVSAVKKCPACLVEVAVVRSLSLGSYFTARRRRRSPFSQGPPFAHPHGRDAGTGLLEVGRPLLLFCPECLCWAIIIGIRLLACLLACLTDSLYLIFWPGRCDFVP